MRSLKIVSFGLDIRYQDSQAGLQIHTAWEECWTTSKSVFMNAEQAFGLIFEVNDDDIH